MDRWGPAMIAIVFTLLVAYMHLTSRALHAQDDRIDKAFFDFDHRLDQFQLRLVGCECAGVVEPCEHD